MAKFWLTTALALFLFTGAAAYGMENEILAQRGKYVDGYAYSPAVTPCPAYYKTREEIAWDLLMYSLQNVPRKGKVAAKCLARLGRLEDRGYELRRPEADYLRDGIYELRVGYQRRNYRMLYFFHGRIAAVVSHGLEKERAIPPQEIDLAVTRKRKFEQDPQAHTE